MIVQTSPILGGAARCHSPLASPLDSPKVSGAGFLWSGGAGPAAGASQSARYRCVWLRLRENPDYLTRLLLSGLAMAGDGQWPLCPAAPGTEPLRAAAPCPAGAAARRDSQQARPMPVTSSSPTAPPSSTTTSSPARVSWTWRRAGDPPPSDPDPDL